MAELPTGDDIDDQVRQSAVAGMRVRQHLIHKPLVRSELATAEGIREQLRGQCIVKLVLLSVQIVLQAGQARDWRSISQGQRVFDRLVVAIVFSPAAERVEMFEGEAERVDARVAVDAR